MTVICDWLDVTFAPDDVPEICVTDVLQASGAECRHNGSDGSVWSVGDGVLKIQYAAAWARISASGAVLSHLRFHGLFLDYLSALAESPHKVTRLDAAHDVLADAAPIIAKLRRRYPRECALTRKALRTKSILTTRSDGRESGTWYVGHRSTSKVTARVYDKQLEALEKRGEELPAMTRYEITIKGDMGPTLRDAADPDKIFWHYAAPALLKRPQDVPEWRSGWGGAWSYDRPETPLAGLLKARIESSADLAAIVALATRADCLDYCVSLIERTVRQRADAARLKQAS